MHASSPTEYATTLYGICRRVTDLNCGILLLYAPQTISIMQNIPSDPIILLSFINTRLRDQYQSLDQLCADLDIDRKALESTLNDAGFEYMPEQNQFR